MNKLNLVFIISFQIFLFNFSFGQGPPVEDADYLEKQKTVLKNTHPHVFKVAEIHEVKKINDDHSRVKYTRDGVYHEAIINSGRKDMLLLETAQELKQDVIPQIVKDALKKYSEYKDATIVKGFEVKRPQGDRLYRLDISTAANKDQTQTVYFDHLGNPAKSPL